MFTPCAAMPASAKNFYLVYKIAFLHNDEGKVRKTFLGIIIDAVRKSTIYEMKRSKFQLQNMERNQIGN